ncbi:MAG: DUF1127 domain-containing protein [Silicimonas sp.]|nr:DUF1127 domain-containing protein [Silicimonas sp.]
MGIQSAFAPTRAGTGFRPFRTIRQLLSEFRERKRIRRDMERLSRLSDHMLRDMGLTRDGQRLPPSEAMDMIGRSAHRALRNPRPLLQDTRPRRQRLSDHLGLPTVTPGDHWIA